MGVSGELHSHSARRRRFGIPQLMREQDRKRLRRDVRQRGVEIRSGLAAAERRGVGDTRHMQSRQDFSTRILQHRDAERTQEVQPFAVSRIVLVIPRHGENAVTGAQSPQRREFPGELFHRTVGIVPREHDQIRIKRIGPADRLRDVRLPGQHIRMQIGEQRDGHTLQLRGEIRQHGFDAPHLRQSQRVGHAPRRENRRKDEQNQINRVADTPGAGPGRKAEHRAPHRPHREVRQIREEQQKDHEKKDHEQPGRERLHPPRQLRREEVRPREKPQDMKLERDREEQRSPRQLDLPPRMKGQDEPGKDIQKRYCRHAEPHVASSGLSDRQNRKSRSPCLIFSIRSVAIARTLSFGMRASSAAMTFSPFALVSGEA